MLVVDSALFRWAVKACRNLAGSFKQAVCRINRHSGHKHQQPVLPVGSPVSSTADTDRSGTSRANSSSNNSASTVEPVSIIVEPAIEDQSEAAKAPEGPNPGDAAAAAADKNAASVAAPVDTTNATEPFPMRRVLLGGVRVILSLWAAQVRCHVCACICAVYECIICSAVSAIDGSACGVCYWVERASSCLCGQHRYDGMSSSSPNPKF
jgi:hypothetical protein